MSARSELLGARQPLPRRDDLTADSFAALLHVVCFFIGFTAPLSELLDKATVAGLSPAFAAASLLSILGWWRGVTHRVILRYAGWGALFSVTVLISSVTVGGNSLRTAFNVSWWISVVIPGLAIVLSDRVSRRAMLRGLVFGAGVFLFVAVTRAASGQSVIDTVSGDENRRLLGLNRYVVDRAVVWIVPLMMVKHAYAKGWFWRWAFVISSVIWIAASQGRTGAIGLVLGPLVVAALSVKPSESSSTKRFALLALAGVVVFVALSNVSIPGFGATERIESARSGELTSSDDLRVLLMRKSIALAKENPLLGVGWNESSKAYHPIIEEATTGRMRQSLLTTHAHNAFLEVWANSGTLALIAWIGVLGTLLLTTIKRAHVPELRALAGGLAAIILGIAFHSAFGADLFIVMAVVLGAAADPTNDAPRTPTDQRTRR